MIPHIYQQRQHHQSSSPSALLQPKQQQQQPLPKDQPPQSPTFLSPSQSDGNGHSQRKHLSIQSQSRSRNQLLVALCLVALTSLARVCSGAPSPQNAIGSNAVSGVGGAAPGSGEVMMPMKDSNWLKGYEPSCDELRAMWRFSKRQSRASEITNEIPTFRGDPFAMNVWQPSKPMMSKQAPGLMKSRNPARFMYDRSGKLMRNSARNGIGFPQFFPGLGPVYGRVLNKPPELMEYGYQVEPQSQRKVQYRFPGPSPGNSPPANAVVARMSGSTPLNVPQRGSFMKLKELVWTERARELAHQRRSEEMQARAAVLKELANGGHG